MDEGRLQTGFRMYFLEIPYSQCTCVSINPGNTVLSRRSIISLLDTFKGLEDSKEASWWISDFVVGAMERILPLVRDISIV